MYYNIKYLKILRWLRKKSFEEVLLLMKKNLHLLDEQIVYHLDYLKKQKMIKFSNYRYQLTIKGIGYLLYGWIIELVGGNTKKKEEDFTIDEKFFSSYLPKQ